MIQLLGLNQQFATLPPGADRAQPCCPPINDGGLPLALAALDERASAVLVIRQAQVGAGQRGGLGLGLYIARCVVDAHGGSIRAESKPGTGTRMSLRLPALASAPQRTVRKDGEQIALDRLFQ